MSTPPNHAQQKLRTPWATEDDRRSAQSDDTPVSTHAAHAAPPPHMAPHVMQAPQGLGLGMPRSDPAPGAFPAAPWVTKLVADTLISAANHSHHSAALSLPGGTLSGPSPDSLSKPRRPANARLPPSIQHLSSTSLHATPSPQAGPTAGTHTSSMQATTTRQGCSRHAQSGSGPSHAPPVQHRVGGRTTADPADITPTASGGLMRQRSTGSPATPAAGLNARTPPQPMQRKSSPQHVTPSPLAVTPAAHQQVREWTTGQLPWACKPAAL